MEAAKKNGFYNRRREAITWQPTSEFFPLKYRYSERFAKIDMNLTLVRALHTHVRDSD